jgi:hypothetical protein
VLGGLAVAGDLLLPTSGLAGFALRAAVFAAMPVVLWSTGFLHPDELDQAVALVRRLRMRLGAA